MTEQQFRRTLPPEFDADVRELKCRIAVELGWVKPARSPYGYDTFLSLKDISWLDGNGAFEAGNFIANPDVLCPDWPRDLHTALLLWDGEEAIFSIMQWDAGHWSVSATQVIGDDTSPVFNANDVKPTELAFHAVRAWLAWRDAKRGAA